MLKSIIMLLWFHLSSVLILCVNTLLSDSLVDYISPLNHRVDVSGQETTQQRKTVIQGCIPENNGYRQSGMNEDVNLGILRQGNQFKNPNISRKSHQHAKHMFDLNQYPDKYFPGDLGIQHEGFEEPKLPVPKSIKCVYLVMPREHDMDHCNEGSNQNVVSAGILNSNLHANPQGSEFYTETLVIGNEQANFESPNHSTAYLCNLPKEFRVKDDNHKRDTSNDILKAQDVPFCDLVNDLVHPPNMNESHISGELEPSVVSSNPTLEDMRDQMFTFRPDPVSTDQIQSKMNIVQSLLHANVADLINKPLRKRNRTSSDCSHLRMASLRLEGDLSIGHFAYLSSDITHFMYRAMQTLLKIDAPGAFQQEIRESIPERLGRANDYFFRCFFGSISILCYQNARIDKHAVIMQGWEFLNRALTQWHSVREMEKNVSQLVSINKGFHDFKTPMGLLSYLIHAHQRSQYGETVLYSLLNFFARYTQQNQLIIKPLYFHPTSFQRWCEAVTMWRETNDSYLKPQSSPNSASKNVQTFSQKKAQIFSRKPQTRLKKPKSQSTQYLPDSNFDIETWNKGIDLVSKDNYLAMEVRYFFFQMRHDLIQAKPTASPYIQPKQSRAKRPEKGILGLGKMFDENQSGNLVQRPKHVSQDIPSAESSFDKKDTYLMKHSSMMTRLERVVSVARDWITPAFMGTVKVFHENLRKTSTLDFMIQHAWEFLKAQFSLWKTEKFRWLFYDQKLPSQSKIRRQSPDWTNSQEVLELFMNYGSKNAPNVRYVEYLARQWQDSIIHHVIN